MNKLIFFYLNQIQRHNPETLSHSCRVSNVSCLIGQYLGLSFNELYILKNAAYLHDLGKIKVSQRILVKKERLSEEEWEQIKNHPNAGYRLLKRTKKPVCQISDAILAHHEYYDGSGYPKGIKGEDIPFIARIISVADGFDAMITMRPYRNAMPIAEAYREIGDCSGSQFDPYITRTLLKTSINDLALGIYRFPQLARS